MITKPKILFVTQTLGYKSACGIGLIGHLFGQGLAEHPEFTVEVFYTDSAAEVKEKIRNTNPNAVLYNYNPTTTPWVDDITLRIGEFEHIPQARVMHDIEQSFVNKYSPDHSFGWKFNFTSDHVLKGNRYIFPATRLIPPPPTVEYKESSIPIIGYQGFGFKHKGIDRIAHQVVKEFDEAIIRLHVPFAFYGDRGGAMARQRIEEVKQIVSSKPGIEIIASHDLLSTEDIINFLGQNTVNCYFYDYQDGVALSSSLDYGIAAHRPVATTRSHQMRNVWDLTPTILIEQTSLKQIIQNDIEPLKPLYKLYSKEQFWEDYSRGINILLNLD